MYIDYEPYSFIDLVLVSAVLYTIAVLIDKVLKKPNT